MPLRTIPERGQVSENVAHTSIKQRCAVLHDRVERSKFANEPAKLSPEARAFAGNPGFVSGRTDVLARKPARDNVNAANSIGSKSLCGKLAHISVAGDIGPVLGEDATGEVFDFAEGDRLEAARSFEAKAKPSYAGK